MATVRPSGAGDVAVGTGEVKDGGSIFQAGNADTTTGPISNAVTIVGTVDDLRDVGAKVVANDGTGAATTDRVGVAKALSGGTLAYNATASQWVMRGGGVTSTLSNVATTALDTTAANWKGVVRDGVHELLTTRRLGTQVFDIYATPSTDITPNYTKGAGAGTAQTYHDGLAASGVATDNAATPTRSVPGELTYHFGGLAAPTTDEYKAKDAFES
jgi:hypothetical protein